MTQTASIHQVTTTETRLHSLLDQGALRLIGNTHFETVIDSYNESWRHYHSLWHILEMLEQVHKIRSTITDMSHEEWLGLQLMILYHDVHFKVAREPGHNERMSAQLCMQHLPADTPPNIRTLVQHGIIASRDWRVDEVPEAYRYIIGIFLDLDLMRLGRSRDSFLADMDLLWQEAQPAFTREEFDAHKLYWAEALLQRSNIYYTSAFHMLEGQARSNLSRFIK